LIVVSVPFTVRLPPIVTLPVVVSAANVGLSLVPTQISAVNVVPADVSIDNTPEVVL
jgi:hypothetical protein